MVDTVPWEGARVIGISRKPSPAAEHLEADLADPSSWAALGDAFRQELSGFAGDRVVFVHAAGAVGPIGFAEDLDTDAYTASVLLNSAAPQVVGQLFLAAARNVAAHRHLVMLTSGAASSVYPGWAVYGAGKATIDQWVRDVGAEQATRGGAQVLAVAPGAVDTGLQEQLRETSEEEFPKRQKFLDLHKEGKLSDPYDTATAIWGLLGRDLDSGSVIDLRELANPAG